jgi:hypothetical protein
MRRIRTALAAAILGAAALAGPAAAQDADTPLDRALQQVQALLETLRAKSDTDPKLLQRLEEIAADLRKAKDAAAPGGGPAAPPGGPSAGGLAPGALDRAKEWFFRGVELKDEDRSRAEEILKEFATDYNLAKSHDDEKSRKVIHEHAEKLLARGFPSREANRMKINLSGIVEFWEGRWGRGGR